MLRQGGCQMTLITLRKHVVRADNVCPAPYTQRTPIPQCLQQARKKIAAYLGHGHLCWWPMGLMAVFVWAPWDVSSIINAPCQGAPRRKRPLPAGALKRHSPLTTSLTTKSRKIHSLSSFLVNWRIGPSVSWEQPASWGKGKSRYFLFCSSR